MAHIHFPVGTLCRLLEHTFSVDEHRPSFSQMADGRLRHDGRDIDFESVAGAELAKELTQDAVDFSKVPPGLDLVGDQGIYLMSNGVPGIEADGEGRGALVAYAIESDPRGGDFEDWHEAKREIFGGDDAADRLGPTMVRSMPASIVQAHKDGRAGEDLYLTMELSPESMGLVKPAICSASDLNVTPRGNEAEMPSQEGLQTLVLNWKRWPDVIDHPEYEETNTPDEAASPGPRSG